MTDVDESELDAFARRMWPSLVRSAMFLGAGREEAEDLAQTVLMRCVHSWPRVKAASDQSAYVYRALLNAFRKSRRRRWWDEIPASPELISEDQPTDDVAEAAAQRDQLLRALGTLSVDQRAVLVLRFYADLSERQTSEVLGVPVGTVKSRTARALVALDGSLRRTPGEQGLGVGQ